MAADEPNVTAVLIKPRDLQLQIRPIPQPGPHDVLVRMQRVGICGSDVHYWHRGSAGRFVVKNPLVLGHESSGIVVQTGSLVTTLAIGDRVALEPGVPCRTCTSCRFGRYNLCPDIRFCATPPVDGTLCKYFVHPADFCFKLPDRVSYEMGALLEPLAVAVYSVQRCQIAMGDAVLVLGAGPIGLLSLLVAKVAGATQVAITDINAQRLEFAKKLGADSTHLIAAGDDFGQVAWNIEQALGRRPTAALECSGAESSIRLGIQALERRGLMATVGRGPYDVSITLTEILAKELEIRGIFRYANCYPAALQLVTSGRLPLDQLISHHFTLDQAEEAFQKALSGEAIKVMIDI